MSIQDSRMAHYHLFYPFLTVFGVKCPFFHEWHLLFFCSLDSLFNLAFPLKNWMDVVGEKKGIWPPKLQLIRVFGVKSTFFHVLHLIWTSSQTQQRILGDVGSTMGDSVSSRKSEILSQIFHLVFSRHHQWQCGVRRPNDSSYCHTCKRAWESRHNRKLAPFRHYATQGTMQRNCWLHTYCHHQYEQQKQKETYFWSQGQGSPRDPPPQLRTRQRP